MSSSVKLLVASLNALTHSALTNSGGDHPALQPGREMATCTRAQAGHRLVKVHASAEATPILNKPTFLLQRLSSHFFC